jgi:hypothetical protein
VEDVGTDDYSLPGMKKAPPLHPEQNQRVSGNSATQHFMSEVAKKSYFIILKRSA